MTLGEILHALRESRGLTMVAVVGADGLVVDAAHAPDVDVESLAAVAASGLLMMDALGRELGQGIARQAILEYDESLVVLTPLPDDLLLVAVAERDANLGQIRLIIRRATPSITEALATV